jgi:arylsulfatase A-like enzyme
MDSICDDIFALASGWSDVGFNNDRVITPTIDNLAREGVILDQSYVHPVCTP